MGVIQKNQPLFVVVWIGSVVAVLAAAVLGLWALSGADRTLVVVAALGYLLGVQLPTIAVNVPLNNALQRPDSDTLSETSRRQAREGFERRWNRWNVFRTACASIASLVLMVLLLRM